EFRHVLEKHGGLYHLFPTAPRGRKNSGKVLQHLLGLLLDAPGDQVSRGRIEGHLAGNENEAIGLNRLRIRPDRFGSVGGRNWFAGKSAHESSTVGSEKDSRSQHSAYF